MPVASYPLEWPQGFPRWRGARETGKFRTDYAAALKNVQRSLGAFATDSGKTISDPVLSTNHNPNPLAARGALADPGVAVWFTWDGLQVAIAVDRYATISANLQAIHHILEARRVELRHGTLALVRATFTGFKALPAPKGKHWRDILQITGPATIETVGAAYRRRAGEVHPDKPGGSEDAMHELTAARSAALKEIGG